MIIYGAAIDESAVLENADNARDAIADFDSDRYSPNGRATADRDELVSADADIDLPGIEQIYFIRAFWPSVTKLTPGATEATFMLGESVQTGVEARPPVSPSASSG